MMLVLRGRPGGPLFLRPYHLQFLGNKSRSFVGRDAVFAVVFGELLGIIRAGAELAVGQGTIRFRDADADWAVLNQVREALDRMEHGTFGQCLADGEAIEEQRLDAVPWTSYCLKHVQLRDAATQSGTPTPWQQRFRTSSRFTSTVLIQALKRTG